MPNFKLKNKRLGKEGAIGGNTGKEKGDGQFGTNTDNMGTDGMRKHMNTTSKVNGYFQVLQDGSHFWVSSERATYRARGIEPAYNDDELACLAFIKSFQRLQ